MGLFFVFGYNCLSSVNFIESKVIIIIGKSGIFYETRNSVCSLQPVNCKKGAHIVSIIVNGDTHFKIRTLLALLMFQLFIGIVFVIFDCLILL